MRALLAAVLVALAPIPGAAAIRPVALTLAANRVTRGPLVTELRELGLEPIRQRFSRPLRRLDVDLAAEPAQVRALLARRLLAENLSALAYAQEPELADGLARVEAVFDGPSAVPLLERLGREARADLLGYSAELLPQPVRTRALDRDTGSFRPVRSQLILAAAPSGLQRLIDELDLASNPHWGVDSGVRSWRVLK